MKKIVLLSAFFWASAFSGMLWAQAGVDVYDLDASNHRQVVSYNSNGNTLGLYDNGGSSGNYTAGDYYITVTSNCAAPFRFFLQLDNFDISPLDTLYIYDGVDTNGAVRAKINNNMGNYVEQQIYVSSTNATGALTVRFRAVTGTADHAGFSLSTHCGTPCERVEPVIDSVFYRTRNGVVYDSATLRQVPVFDTTWNIDTHGDTLGIASIDTAYFTGAHLCVGDGVIFKGHGIYTHEHGYYNPSDFTSYFVWNMDNEGDTVEGVGVTQVEYDDYQKTGCSNMVLTIADVSGCQSTIYTMVRVRTSTNPIKTIFTLSDICNRDSLLVSMGYDGENATLTLREVENATMVSKVNEVRTFIPDGPRCTGTNGSTCYEAPVLFTEFPASKRISSGADVCSVCINMEHTYMGDISVKLVCPTGQKATLFWGNYDPGRPNGPNDRQTAGNGPADHGSGTDMGCPHSSSSGCDTTVNPYGVGFDYCFSRNDDYTLVTGDRAGSVPGAPRPSPYNGYITARTYTITVNPPVSYVIPPGFSGAGQTVTYSGTTKKPSDHENKLDYYLPYSDFSELIGCPLNGTWSMQVCDDWGADNGWVFNWSMDICGVSQDGDCKYTVDIDSLVWRPDPSPQYHDYDMGHYRGLVVNQVTPVVSYISSPDTAGTFPIDVVIYDQFGCIWDTTTSITTYWTPEPKLGNDTTLCGVDHATLDARDRHTVSENYTYQWSPYGQNTPVIETSSSEQGDVSYVVAVSNNRRNLVCTSRDTINVAVRKQPLPNFVSIPFSFEGCAPMTITFDNQSVNATKYLWEFGDGVTSELASPTHTYGEGNFTLKYYAISGDGCIDSIVAENGVAVFPTPKASFSWEPVYPSALQPTVTFVNNTYPQPPNARYIWEYQYDADNPFSYETLNSYNATVNFANYNGSDVSGNYNVHLIAQTENIGPSGNVVYCSDTAANNVLVINDFLQFPNLVTPNGDGINDRFVIQNLVNGLAYPINSLDVYNKWGSRVFHRENISSEDDFWDPADLPDGTYFYRFSASGYNGNIEHNGAVEVLH